MYFFLKKNPTPVEPPEPVNGWLEEVRALTAGEWTKAPDSNLRPVMLNTTDYGWSNEGSGGKGSVMGAWCSACFDTDTQKLVLPACGGHGDRNGNEVYSWDAVNNAWAAENTPTPPEAGNEPNTSPKREAFPAALLEPHAYHTQGAPLYEPTTGKVLLCGPWSPWSLGNGAATGMYAFDMGTKVWSKPATMTSDFSNDGAPISARHPTTGVLWRVQIDQGGTIRRVQSWDPGTAPATWTDHGNQLNDFGRAHWHAIIHPTLNRLYWFAPGPRCNYYDLANPGNAQTSVTVGGDQTPFSVNGVGLIWDGSNIWAVVGNDPDWYRLDISGPTHTFVKVTGSGTHPISHTPSGVYGRCAWWPQENRVIFVADVSEDVYVGRLP